jgi:hypothetical protein
MPLDDPEAKPTPKSIAAYVKKNQAKARMGSMRGPVESVREDDYQGHHIVVRTTYQITVDDRPVTGHIHLSNEGQVAYHGLPNMTFDSAVGLVRSLIDHFPQDFQPGAGSGDGQSAAGGMPGMAGMSGMSAGRPKKAGAKAGMKSTGRSPKKKASGRRKP